MHIHYLTQFFEYRHMTPNMQAICKPFAHLVQSILELPDNPERTHALRKILEARDCAMRASIFKVES